MNIKSKKKMLLLAVALTTIMVLSGCSSSAYGQGEEFQLNEETYKIDTIVDKGPSTTDGDRIYGVEVLMRSGEIPVTIPLSSETVNPQSQIHMTLFGEDRDYENASINFFTVDDGGYKTKAQFIFSLPADRQFPEKGEITFENPGSDNEVVALSFKDMKVEEYDETSESPVMNAR